MLASNLNIIFEANTQMYQQGAAWGAEETVGTF